MGQNALGTRCQQRFGKLGEKGIALYPTKTDDRSGCFSGSAVEQDGTLYLFYTGVNYLEENPEDINQCQNDQFLAAQLMISSMTV